MYAGANVIFMSTSTFIRRQITQIRQGGCPMFARKFKRALSILQPLSLSVFAVPVVIVMRLIRSWFLIRLGIMNNTRIGHFAANTELYLCERAAGLHPKHVFDVFHYHSEGFCNHQLKKMWERTNLFRIWKISRYLYIANRLLPGYREHIVVTSDRDIHSLYERIPTHLSFTPEEEKKGNDELRKIGIPFEAKIICFMARNSAYLNTIHESSNYSYHNYRDSNIHDYIPAIEELVNRGYYAVRMGAVVKETLGTANHRIIDYAVKHRTEFMDIYISAKCHFFLNGGAGMEAVPMIFRRPIARVNAVPIEYVPSWNEDLFIPKKLWLIKERRFMTFREIMESGAGIFLESEQYAQLGIEPVENTPEEIRAVAVEMDERLKGTWRTTEEDEELQRRFWSLFKDSELHGDIKSRIGAYFLRQNVDLLK